MGRLGRRGVALGVAAAALLLALAAIELAVQLRPQLLPFWFRDRYPYHGVELFRPGALSETPLGALPLPMTYESWDGPPPADLVEMGLVDAGVALDRERYPRVRIPIDARGLPNVRALERADVVLVGDSFAVAAAAVEPPGLVVTLSAGLGSSVYAAALAGVGPHREAWLLEHVGLPLEPRLVLWLYFGGNDVADARRHLRNLRQGMQTHVDRPQYREPPALLLPALLRAWFAGDEGPPSREPLPGLELPLPDGGSVPVWFLPAYLLMAGHDEALLRDQGTWEAIEEILRESRGLAEAGGARFGIVYLPSKAQVYLPHVRPDAELVARMLAFEGARLDDPAETLLSQLLGRRGEQERLLQAFCEREGIPFFTATPHLEAMAARGEVGYLTSDTHWAVEGQAAILDPLVEFSAGLLGQ